MSKISAAFKNKKLFIAYIMAGDPSLAKTKEFILAARRAGAGLVEVGIPFSDPVAEGEVIQRANLRALKQKINLDKVFDMVASIKDKINIPLVFMTYLNPVFNYGYEKFFKQCARCGVSGVIIPDMPFEEQGEIKPAAAKNGVDVLTLVSPSSSDARIKAIAENAQGFIYLVSSYGVTGVRKNINTDISAIVKKIKRHTDVPVAVGFGISTPEQAAEFAKHADGVIVGSAIVKIIENYGPAAAPRVEKYIKSMCKGL